MLNRPIHRWIVGIYKIDAYGSIPIVANENPGMGCGSIVMGCGIGGVVATRKENA